MAVTINDGTRSGVSSAQPCMTTGDRPGFVTMHHYEHSATKLEPRLIRHSAQHCPILSIELSGNVVIAQHGDHRFHQWPQRIEHRRGTNIPGMHGAIAGRHDRCDAWIEPAVRVG